MALCLVGGFVIKGGSSTFGEYLLACALSVGRDTLSVAYRVSIGGNLSVSFPVSVVRGNRSVVLDRKLDKFLYPQMGEELLRILAQHGVGR